MRVARSIAALAAVCLFAGEAMAQCGPLQMYEEVQMRPANAGRASHVPVTINGATRYFLLDTGMSLTTLSPDTAKALNLPVRHNGRMMYGVTGNIASDLAQIKEFGIGRLRGKDVSFPIMNLPQGMQGLLGTEYMSQFDIEVDFGTDKLRFFSPDHCEGKVVYWPATHLGVVAINRRDGKISLPVTLDGKEINAIIDTGASHSTLTQEVAERRFGLTMGTPDTPESGILNGDASVKVYRHSFKELKIGDITVSNPSMTIFPDVMNRNGERTQTVANRARLARDEIKAPDLIVGMNVLRKLRMYMAFKEQKIYVTPASNPAPAPQPANN